MGCVHGRSWSCMRIYTYCASPIATYLIEAQFYLTLHTYTLAYLIPLNRPFLQLTFRTVSPDDASCLDRIQAVLPIIRYSSATGLHTAVNMLASTMCMIHIERKIINTCTMYTFATETQLGAVRLHCYKHYGRGRHFCEVRRAFRGRL